MKLINSQFSFVFLFGFVFFFIFFVVVQIEFIERVNETDPVESVPCQPWSSRASKMTQPNLDYMGMWLLYIVWRFIELWVNIITHYFVQRRLNIFATANAILFERCFWCDLYKGEQCSIVLLFGIQDVIKKTRELGQGLRCQHQQQQINGILKWKKEKKRRCIKFIGTKAAHFIADTRTLYLFKYFLFRSILIIRLNNSHK